MESVVIRKQKRPAGMMEWGAYHVGNDAVGTWLYTPQGSTGSGESADGETAWSYVGIPEEPGLHVMQLVPTSGWWIAHLTIHPVHGRCVAIDISTPPERRGQTWSYEDLELDVLKRGQQVVVVDDEDEFEDACAAGRISSPEAEAARTCTIDLVRSLTGNEFPFDDTVWRHLNAAVALGLPPLRHH